MKKNGLFRPAGGEITFQVSDRVTPVNQMKGRVAWMNSRLRLRQGGRFQLVAKNVAQRATFLATSYIMYHAVAGEAGIWVRHQAGIGCTA